MGIFRFIGKCIKSLFNLFKDKGPAQIIEDASKAAIGVATVATVGYVGFNVIKSMFMKSRKKAKKNKKKQTGDEIYLENREAGSIDEKLANAHSFAYNCYTGGVTEEEAEILEEVAPTRNAAFRRMTPAQQIELLKMEDFDFEKAKADIEAKNSSSIRRSVRRIGQKTSEEETFREPVDYGKLNWIARPLDDFICWLRGEYHPKKVPQKKIFEQNMLYELDITDPEKARASIEIFNEITGVKDETVVDEREVALNRAYIHIISTTKNGKKAAKKAKKVRKEMNQNTGLSQNVLDLMTKDDLKDFKKSKKKKSSKKSDGKKHKKVSEESYFFGFEETSSHKEKKKSKDKGSKKESFDEEKSVNDAKKSVGYFMKKWMDPDLTYTGKAYEHP